MLIVLYIQLSIAHVRPPSWCSTFMTRPKPVANSSFLSATPSPFVSVYFQTSSAFDSFARIGVGAERHHEAREDEVVDEHVVRLVDAVVVLVLVHGDAADRLERAGAVGVLHVAAQLEHEHPAVAVERDLRRLLDVRIGQHRRPS